MRPGNAPELDPSELAAAVRALAADAHRVLSRIAGSPSEDDSEPLRALLDRIAELRRLPDEARWMELRLWLDSLQRQVLIVKSLGELGRRVERLERQAGGAPDHAPEAAPCPEP